MKKSTEESSSKVFIKFLVLTILWFLISFFIIDIYKTDLVYTILITLLSLTLFYQFWKRGFFNFLLVSSVGIFSFISLEISFNLGIFVTFILALALAIVLGLIYNKIESRRSYAILLLVAFVIIWAILAFNVTYRDDWIIENYLTIPFVVLLLIVFRWFKLSKTSYSLIFIYMVLHIIGSHYTYAEVPFGFWLQNFFGLGRNHYDRIVHFSFGFLLAYPVREVFIRLGNYKGIWALFAPIMLVFGLSAVYEIVEWGAAVQYGGDLGVAYLGTQGDVWDAQKDMFVAGIGSIIAMFITTLVLFVFKGKEYWIELKESFKVKHLEQGEVVLQRLEKRK